MAKKHRPGRQITSASALSRERAASRYATKLSQRKRHKGLKAALGIIGAFVLVAAGLVALYLGGIQGRLSQGVDPALLGALSSSSIKDPFYMLLLGTDKSKERAQSAEYGQSDSNYRSDSIILARIDPAHKLVTLVSIERDTLVHMGDHGTQKINAAYSLGGAAYAVDVVSKFAGVPISHYAEINFDDFVGVVDKIGGVDVNIKIDLEDELAGLSLKAGQQTIDGAQALALCRARHAYDQYGGGDYYRTANQRMVIGAIIKKVLAADPLTLANSVNEMAGSVTTDLSLQDILSLANSFRGFDMSTNMYSGLEPTESKYVNGVWYELVKEDEWKEMMDRVNKGLSPYSDESQDFTLHVAGEATAIKNEDGSESSGASPSDDDTKSGNVLVLNGAGVNGLAGQVASTLRSVGYTCQAATAERLDYTVTEVLYVGDKNKDMAQSVADQLGLATVKADDGTHAKAADFDPQVIVILGSDMADFD